MTLKSTLYAGSMILILILTSLTGSLVGTTVGGMTSGLSALGNSIAGWTPGPNGTAKGGDAGTSIETALAVPTGPCLSEPTPSVCR